jgi:nitrate/TMAO reductase-like tetraheme cytochrome c subunit
MCKICQEEFEGNTRQKYCSDECRKKAKRIRSLDYYYDVTKKNPEKYRDYKRDYRAKNKKKLSEKRRERRKKRWQKLKELIGDSCKICKNKKQIRFHEIHGKDHDKYDTIAYILRHKEDFVSLCRDCHRALHHLSKKEMNIEELLRFLVLLNEP